MVDQGRQFSGGEATSYKRLWRKPQPSEAVARTWLYSRRLLLFVAVAGLLLAFAVNITSIFRQPRTHIFVFEDQIVDCSQLENIIAIEPLPYPHSADQLFVELQPAPADPAAAKSGKANSPPAPRCQITTVSQLGMLGQQIARQRQDGTIHHRDAVLIYLRAQGITRNGEPILLTHSGNPEAPITQINVGELLDELAFPSEATVLMLDYGTLPNDLPAGVIVNNFADALQKTISGQNRPNLWVMASHSLFERSLVSDESKRSLFEQIIAAALVGRGDADFDGWVELGELFNFVRTQFRLQVGERTDGLAEQTPRFYWCGASGQTPLGDQRLISAQIRLKESLPQSGGAVGRAHQRSKRQVAGWNLMRTWGRMPLAVNQPFFATAMPQSANQATATPTAAKSNSGAATDASTKPSAPQSAANPTSNSTVPAIEPKRGKAPSSRPSAGFSKTLKTGWEIYQLLQTEPVAQVGQAERLPLSAYAPDSCKRLETLLVYATTLARRPGNADLPAIQVVLEEQVLPLKTFAPSSPLRDAQGLARMIDRSFPRGAIRWPDPGSMTLLTWLAQKNAQPLAKAQLQLIADFESALQASEQTAMQTWLKTNARVIGSYREAQLCQQLLTSKAPWPLCQLAIRTFQLSVQSRLAEGVVSQFTQQKIRGGDELLDYGLLMLQPAQADDAQAIAAAAFENAANQYRVAIGFCDRLAALKRYLWQVTVSVNADQFPAVTPAMRARLQNLSQLSADDLENVIAVADYLRAASGSNPVTLNQIVAPLQFPASGLPRPPASLFSTSMSSVIPAGANTASVDVPGLAESGDASDLEGRSGSPIPIADHALQQLAAPTVPAKTPPQVMSHQFSQRSMADLIQPDPIAVERWLEMHTTVERHYLKAKLSAALTGLSSREFQQLQSSYAALNASFETFRNNKTQGDDSVQQIALEQLETFATGLAAFQKSQAAAPASFSNRAGPSTNSAASDSKKPAAIPLNLYYPLWTMPSESFAARLLDTRGNELLAQHVRLAATALRNRELNAISGSMADFERRQQTAEQIEPELSGKPLPLPAESQTLPVRVSSNRSVDLQTATSGMVRLDLQSQVSEDQDVWIVVELDTTQYNVEPIIGDGDSTAIADDATESMPVTVVDSRLPAVTHDNAPLFKPLSTEIAQLTRQAPTLKLPARGQSTVVFQVTRTGAKSLSSRCLFKVVTSQRIVRQPVLLECGQVNPVQLVFGPTSGVIKPNETGWRLEMLPNSQVELNLLANNSSASQQTVDLTLYSVSQPPDDLPAMSIATELAAQVQQYWSEPQVIAKSPGLKVIGNADRAPLFATAAPAAGKASPASQAPISSYLVAVLENKTAGLTNFIPLEVDVLHPRDYLEPQVSYDSASKSLLLRLNRQPLDTPLASPIKVRVSLAAASAADNAATFPITLPAQQQRVRFETELNNIAGGEVELTLEVDEYPRAFRYQLPLDRSSRNLPESSQAQLQIISPDPFAAYSNQTTNVPVNLQADMGLLSAAAPQGQLEFGIDINQDRELSGEPTVQIASDRLPLLFNSGTISQWQLRNTVTDLKLLVPVDTLVNQRVNLLGRIRSAAGDVWSTPVEIILDSQPPQVLSVDLLTAPLVVGQPIDIAIKVTDQNLSGVSEVGTLLDLAGTGEIPATAKLTQAKLNDNGMWTATLPTATAKPGSFLILTRATDRAGNLSRTSRTLVSLISADQFKQMQQAPNKTVRGRILYGGRPVPDASATLKNAAGKTIATRVSNADGRFTLDKIAPGDYELEIRGIARGKIRTHKQPLKLVPTSREIDVQIKLE